MGRRRRKDVSEVGEEEEGRESDKEQLRAIHGASRRRTAWLCYCLGRWASSVSVSLQTRAEGGSLAVAGRKPPLQPATWVPFISGSTRRPASLVPWWRVGRPASGSEFGRRVGDSDSMRRVDGSIGLCLCRTGMAVRLARVDGPFGLTALKSPSPVLFQGTCRDGLAVQLRPSLLDE